MDIILSGLLLGGTYALIAMGLNLQYGVARIMNLANGEMLVLGGLAAFWVFTTTAISPLLTIFVVAPLAFAGNWLIYRFLLLPLVRRSKSQGQLEVDSILATFGMSFALVGVMVSIHGEYFTYSYTGGPVFAPWQHRGGEPPGRLPGCLCNRRGAVFLAEPDRGRNGRACRVGEHGGGRAGGYQC